MLAGMIGVEFLDAFKEEEPGNPVWGGGSLDFSSPGQLFDYPGDDPSAVWRHMPRPDEIPDANEEDLAA